MGEATCKKKKMSNSTQIGELPIKLLNIMILEKSIPNRNLLFHKKIFVVNV